MLESRVHDAARSILRLVKLPITGLCATPARSISGSLGHVAGVEPHLPGFLA